MYRIYLIYPLIKTKKEIQDQEVKFGLEGTTSSLGTIYWMKRTNPLSQRMGGLRQGISDR
jgi:hypothetical protein